MKSFKMYNHSPVNYDCPFCKVSQNRDFDSIYTKQEDVFYWDEDLTAFIGSHSWPKNHGNTIIISNEHFENIYDIPETILMKIATLSKKIAIAMKKEYGCDGISTRQHNEPAGNQDIWHFHYHIIPRFENDRLYERTKEKKLSDPIERSKFAAILRNHFKTR